MYDREYEATKAHYIWNHAPADKAAEYAKTPGCLHGQTKKDGSKINE